MRWQEPRRPRRLSETAPAGSALARALTSARDRRPSHEETRTLEDGLFAALGAGVLSATAGLTAKAGAPVALSAAPAAMSSAPAALSAPVAMSALTSIAVKAALVVALGTGGALLGARALRPAPIVPPAPAAVRAPAPPSPTPPAPVVEATIPIAPTPVEPIRRPSRLQPAERRESPAATSAPSASRSPAPSPTLRAELQLIEDARAALSHEPARALLLCEAHRRTFVTGVMAEERDAIAVTALLALDRLPDARTALDVFRRRYPSSPQTPRLIDAMTRSSSRVH